MHLLPSDGLARSQTSHLSVIEHTYGTDATTCARLQSSRVRSTGHFSQVRGMPEIVMTNTEHPFYDKFITCQ